MKMVRLIFTVLICIASCGKSDHEILRDQEKTLQPWGLPFEIKPIRQAGAQQKNWAKAISFIENISGFTATGYFISSDGLFLTNNHVITLHGCSQVSCRGYRIIRDFSPGGDMQVFTKFKVLATNEYYDFTLLKVDIGSGRVPFIELNDDPKILLSHEMSIIGHPLSASTRVTQSRIGKYQDSFELLSSGTLMGNSGSPILDPNTNKAIGILHSMGMNPGTLMKDSGSFLISSAGTSSVKILEMIRRLYPEFPKIKEEAWVTDPTVNSHSYLKDIRPPTKEETQEQFLRDFNLDTLVTQYLGTENEQKRSDEFFAHLLSQIDNKGVARFSSLILGMKLTLIGLRRNQVPLATSQPDIVRSVLKSFEDPGKTSLSILYGFSNTVSCLIDAKPPLDSFYSGFFDFSQRCLSTENMTGNPILQELESTYWALKKAIPAEKHELLYSDTLRTLVLQTELADFSDSKSRAIALQLLEDIANSTLFLSDAFQAELLYTKIQAYPRIPSLIGRGSFKSTFL